MKRNIIIIVSAVVVAALVIGGGLWAKSNINHVPAAEAPTSTTQKVEPVQAPLIDSDKLPKEETTEPEAPRPTVSVPKSIERQNDKMSQDELDTIFEAMMKDKGFKNMPYLLSLRDDVCSNLVDSASGADVVNSLQEHTGWDDEKVGYFVGATLSTRCPDQDGKVTQ